MRTLIEEFFNGIMSRRNAKQPSIEERVAAYEAAMQKLLDPDAAPQPGGLWCQLSRQRRIAEMERMKSNVPFFLTNLEAREWEVARGQCWS